MFEINNNQLNYENSQSFWSELASEIQGILVPELIPNLANITAMIYSQMPSLNWVGFYLYDGKKLVLGPFQGKPACIYIPLEKGVCGKAASTLTSILVDDVDRFPGHIVCDSASKSELVVPIKAENGNLFGVLDLDSPVVSRFKESDLRGLEQIVAILEKTLLA